VVCEFRSVPRMFGDRFTKDRDSFLSVICDWVCDALHPSKIVRGVCAMRFCISSMFGCVIVPVLFNNIEPQLQDVGTTLST
jgi:hypothetical protein